MVAQVYLPPPVKNMNRTLYRSDYLHNIPSKHKNKIERILPLLEIIYP